MAGRSRPNAPRPPVLADNAHFSDSASSHDGASDDESHHAHGAATGGLEAHGRGGGGARRRRSGGIPSLISRHGSRSNLGTDTGISRAHEISRQALDWLGRRNCCLCRCGYHTCNVVVASVGSCTAAVLVYRTAVVS